MGWFSSVTSPSSSEDAASITSTTSILPGNGITITSTSGIGGGGGSGGSGLIWGGPTGLHQSKPITKEEQAELDSLENELKSWTKVQKIIAFKFLHRNLRQDIVDEACYMDFYKNIMSVDASKFPDATKLAELQEKKQGYYIDSNGLRVTGIHAGVNLGYAYAYSYGYSAGSPSWRFAEIHGIFTKEELMTAHAEITLEEELNSST